MGRLIDADILIEKMNEVTRYLAKDTIYCSNMIYMVQMSPTVEAEPVRHGKLVDKVYDEWYTEWADCTVCGRSNHAHAKYCQWCGAKFDLEESVHE